MPTESEMLADLDAADKAGDAQLAQHIAGQIKAARAPQPSAMDRLKSLGKEGAHFAAKAAPVVGGIVGGVLGAGAGGLAGAPSGPGAVLTSLAGGAAGAGLLSAAGKSVGHSIDTAIGYEDNPGIAAVAKDSLKTGAQDAAATAIGGAAVPILVKGAGAVGSRAAPLLDLIGNKFGRRVLNGGATPLTVKAPLSPEALDAAHEAGAFRPWGTTRSAATAIEGAREITGAEYGRIVKELEAAGVQGPDIPKLAQEYLARQSNALANTAGSRVANIYGEAAETMSRQGTKTGPAAPVLPQAVRAPGGEPVSGVAAYQGEMNANPHGDLAELLAARASGPSDGPLTSYLAGPRNPEGLIPPVQVQYLMNPKAMQGGPDLPSSAWLRTNTSPSSDLGNALKVAPKVRLGLTQGENIKRSFQDQASAAYKQLDPGEVGEAKTDAASILRAAVERSIERQAALAPRAAADFVPVKQRLGPLIEAGNAADRGAVMADRRHAISLIDLLAATAGGHGDPLKSAGVALGSKALRTFGPSAATWALKGGANAAGGIANTPEATPRAAGLLLGSLAGQKPDDSEPLRRLLLSLAQQGAAP